MWWGHDMEYCDKVIWIENAKYVLTLKRLGYLKAVAISDGYRGILTPQGQAFLNLTRGLRK